VWFFAEEECKRSTIWLKKDGVVYDLTEIDSRRSDREIHVPPPPRIHGRQYHRVNEYSPHELWNNPSLPVRYKLQKIVPITSADRA
jgi:hypothetical protein